jgi:hypothetical protein
MQMNMQKKPFMRLFRVCFSFFLAITSFIGAFFLLSIALARAMQTKELRDRIRRFNKQTLNPAALKIAGNRSGIYAALKHVGRRSGREYMTPLVAHPLGDGFVIPLPYGVDVDWCRNVVAAGKCMLTWNEQEYALERPEIIPTADALSAYPLSQKIIFRVGGVKQCLWLHKSEIPAEVMTSA